MEHKRYIKTGGIHAHVDHRTRQMHRFTNTSLRRALEQLHERAQQKARVTQTPDRCTCESASQKKILLAR